MTDARRLIVALIAVAALGPAAASPASAQEPKQVADINPGPGGSLSFGGSGEIPTPDLSELGGFLYFGADDGADGDELWRSNGTTTEQVADINPGADPSIPRGFAELGGFLYFSAVGADDEPSGDRLRRVDVSKAGELWRTNGTTTERVRDINPGDEGSDPQDFARLGDFLYFQAGDGASGREPWRTDGTTTERVADIRPGDDESSFPNEFTRLGGFLYFNAQDGATGSELWRTDGTTTELFRDINPRAASSFAGGFTQLGDFLYFQAGDGASGRELWRTDGTTAERVEDINPGPGDSSPTELTRLGDFLYFTASETDHFDRRLWRTDGTTTERVADVRAYDFSEPIGGFLYFAGDDHVHGIEPWRTDGTTTERIADLNPGPGDAWDDFGSTGNRRSGGFTGQDGFVYFAAGDTDTGHDDLWRTDGTTTVKVQDDSGPFSFTPFAGSLFFAAFGDGGRELWRIGEVRPVDPGPGPGQEPPPANQDARPADPAPQAPAPVVTPPVVTPPRPAPKVAQLLSLPSSRRCASRRKFTVRVRRTIRGQVSRVTIFVDGKRVKTVKGKRIGLPIDLRGLPKGKVKIRLKVELKDGRVATDTRRYRTCTPKKKRRRSR